MANNLPVRAKPVWISSATKTIPCASQIFFTACTNDFGGIIKPPSPCTGSITTQATSSGSTVSIKKSSNRAIACASKSSCDTLSAFSATLG